MDALPDRLRPQTAARRFTPNISNAIKVRSAASAVHSCLGSPAASVRPIRQCAEIYVT